MTASAASGSPPKAYRQLRPYRALRVALAVLDVMPRYAWLNLRAAFGRPASAETWNRVHTRAALRIRGLALDLAGAFTKAAQIGGARADMFPEPFIEILSQFHDAVPPRPFESLRPVVERDLGGPLEARFSRVDGEALAAASLAQVHRATLRDGREVVVKIQYPEARRIIPLDLRMLRLVAGLIHRMQRTVDLRSVVNEVAHYVELELDFRNEVRSTLRLGEVLAEWPDVRVPEVEVDLCGDDTIVLEYLEGIQVARTREWREAGHRTTDVARKIGALYGAMMFELGSFHGDPHPGNLLVLPDGRIGLLDFGLCKDLPEGFAYKVADMMVCALVGDNEGSIAAARALGFDTFSIRPEHLRRLMLMIIGDRDGEEGLLDILSESQVRTIPPDFALVLRTLVLLNGLSHRLAPGRRLIQAELIQHLAKGAAAGAPLAA
ncbi:MAG: AarF/ABC1/UbiB kinase family protein [Myxococcota bacterium]|nr:AarF/ABC1/UbiB kinase family protein [Myxococcota bacterium]